MPGLLGRRGGGLDLVIVGLAEVSTALARLRAIQARMDDTRPVLRALVPVLEKHYRTQYASGTGWAPDSPRTLLQKITGRTLVEKGRLRASMTGGPGNVVRLSRDQLFYGTDVPYAAQLARGARGMPRRDPAQLNLAAFQRDAGQVVADYVAGNGGRLRLGT